VVVAIPLESVVLFNGFSEPRPVPEIIEKDTEALSTGIPAASLTVAVIVVLLDGPREAPVEDNSTVEGGKPIDKGIMVFEIVVNPSVAVTVIATKPGVVPLVTTTDTNPLEVFVTAGKKVSPPPGPEIEKVMLVVSGTGLAS